MTRFSSSPVTLTSRAVARLRELSRDGSKTLRIGLKKGGCAGMEYQMDLVSDASPADMSVQQDGVRILLAPEAQMFLLGSVIDFESGLLDSGFRFDNPNVTAACGCGESVSFGREGLSEVPLLKGH